MPVREHKRADDVVQLINFRLRDEEFGVDISSVREITRVTDMSHIPEAPFFIHGVIGTKGKKKNLDKERNTKLETDCEHVNKQN